jgi:hypothetical protein
LVLLSVVNNPHLSKKKAVRKYSVIIALTGLLFCIVMIAIKINHAYNTLKVYYCLLLFILSFLCDMLYIRFDETITRDAAAAKTRNDLASLAAAIKAQPTNSWIYFPVLGITLVFFYLFNWVTDLRDAVPESLLLLIFSFYVLVIDLIHYTFRAAPIPRYILNAVGIAILALFVIRGLPYRYLKLKYWHNPRPAADLADFRDYYDKWKTRLKGHDAQHPYEIILVSGEGGGSRAGYWFSQGLMSLDSVAGGRLKDHIFSMSTVSGSSVGLGAVLSYWTFLRENSIAPPDHPWTDLPRRVFRYNFVGGNISGLLVTDLLKNLLPWSIQGNRDWEQQTEEAECVQQALWELRDGKGDTKILFTDKAHSIPDSDMIMKRDFMSFYYPGGYPDAAAIDTSLPLIFVNTTRSSDGRRGIYSPIRLNPDDFKDALDICRFLYTEKFKSDTTWYGGLNRGIPLGAACNSSEIFPYFSSPVLIDSLGYFLDGGYHENSGLKTTLEVYDKLRYLLDNDPDTTIHNSYHITVLYFKNAEYKKTYYPGEIDHPIASLQPLQAVFNQPFTGSESYFEEVARVRLGSDLIRFQLEYNQLLDPSKTIFYLPDSIMPRELQDEILSDIVTVKITKNDSLPGSKADTARTVNFPLARWLSNFIIDEMRANCHRELIDSVRDAMLMTCIKDQ